MKKTTAIILATMALAGCEGDDTYAIRECGYACKRADAKMVKWNKADGCVCDTPPAATARPQ